MTETFFAINDLFRRKHQTALVVLSLTLCVASTLFLLLFADRIGLGISLTVQNRLTSSFSTIFSSFIAFVGLLIFIVGTVIVSFAVFVMMSQRVRDIGLMKAIGCPNNLIFGYYVTELLLVALSSCIFGVCLGVAADLASVYALANLGFQVSQKPVNLILIVIAFVLFFVLAMIFGGKPILDTTKIKSSQAMSPAHYAGVSKERRFKAVSQSGFTLRLAFRNLFRRKSASLHIVACMSVVFILVTVSVAGGILADQTTRSWVESAVGKDMILIAHREMNTQYVFLLAKFYETRNEPFFNYTDPKYAVPESLISNLSSIVGSEGVDVRLALKTTVREIRGYIFTDQSQGTRPVGDNRSEEALVVGVRPGNVFSRWFMEGDFLKQDATYTAVVGDSVAVEMFDAPLNQSIAVFGVNHDITGICLDPINNGRVAYVPLETLENITGVSHANLVLIKLDPSTNRGIVLYQIRSAVSSANPDFEVFNLNEATAKNVDFLGYLWLSIMLLPLLSLASASVCLIGYVTLILSEQRQEFGILRAVGLRPSAVLKIVSWQSVLVLLASYAVGTAIGIMLTLIILIPEPVVTSYNILQIAGWLSIALGATLVSSIYPALRFSRKPILDVLSKS